MEMIWGVKLIDGRQLLFDKAVIVPVNGDVNFEGDPIGDGLYHFEISYTDKNGKYRCFSRQASEFLDDGNLMDEAYTKG